MISWQWGLLEYIFFFNKNYIEMVINLFNSVDHGGSVSKVLQEEGDLGKPKQTILKIYKKNICPI